MDTTRRCFPARRAVAATIASALFVMLTSCAHKEAHPEVGTTVTTGAATGARMIMNDDAAWLVAKARCQHESACDHVGSGLRYDNADACRREMFDEAWAMVRDETCPTGVDEGRLATCLTDARREPCGDRRMFLDELASCRRADLCATP